MKLRTKDVLYLKVLSEKLPTSIFMHQRLLNGNQNEVDSVELLIPLSSSTYYP